MVRSWSKLTRALNLQDGISLSNLLHLLLGDLDGFSGSFSDFKIIFLVDETLDVVRVSLLSQLKGSLTNVLDVLLMTLLVLLLLLGDLSLQFFGVLNLLLLDGLQTFVSVTLLLLGQLLSSFFLFLLNLSDSLLALSSKN